MHNQSLTYSNKCITVPHNAYFIYQKFTEQYSVNYYVKDPYNYYNDKFWQFQQNSVYINIAFHCP